METSSTDYQSFCDLHEPFGPLPSYSWADIGIEQLPDVESIVEDDMNVILKIIWRFVDGLETFVSAFEAYCSITKQVSLCH